MFSQVSLIELVLILLMGVGGYFYYEHTQTVESTLQANADKLSQAVQTQQAAIAAIQSAQIIQNNALTKLQSDTAQAETERHKLELLFNQKNLTKMAKTNPSDLENRINKATSAQFLDIEKLTTPTQTNATIPTPTTDGTKK